MENKVQHAEEQSVEERLRQALDVPRWIDAMRISGQFADHEAELGGLRTAVLTAATPLTLEEIDRAMTHHPRIGDRPTGSDASARQARTEQSGVDTSDEAVREQIRAGNLAYEQRFGRVFLIRATGRSAADVLSELERRLQHDPATELAVVEAELREIALLRLGGVLPS